MWALLDSANSSNKDKSKGDNNWDVWQHCFSSLVMNTCCWAHSYSLITAPLLTQVHGRRHHSAMSLQWLWTEAHLGFDSKQARNDLPAAPSWPHCLAGLLAARAARARLQLRPARPTPGAVIGLWPCDRSRSQSGRAVWLVADERASQRSTLGHRECWLKASLISHYQNW